MKRRSFLLNSFAASAALLGVQVRLKQPLPDKLIVLTMDDAVKSHRTLAAPLLQQLGFRASFFVTHLWMADRDNFMSWQDIAEIHQMGFEIGNHTWTHVNVSSPRNAARLAGELALVENELRRVKVPRPISFAYPGNHFGPEAFDLLEPLGYTFARRGASPEVEYGRVEVGPRYDPARHHPLLIPTTADAYPDWTFQHFQHVVQHARDGKAVVLQFHGVPDVAHPWVHTPPEMFRRYMEYLKERDFRVIALGDLGEFVDVEHAPDDPLTRARYRSPRDGELALPVEVEATRRDLDYWLGNMIQGHGYSAQEAALVTSLPTADVAARAAALPAPSQPPRLLPYPGGRHPRIGFLDGAIDPQRGTKFSVFLPWDPSSYVVVDVPEAIFCNLGLLYLAHTHVPTIWNAQNVVIDNVDWERRADGSLESRWELPNKVRFGAIVRPGDDDIRMELWLYNGTDAALTGLNTQICVMTKGVRGLTAQTNDNKILRQPVAGARIEGSNRWVLTSWERCRRAWGNPPCPCFHSDPVLPDCAPGEEVRIHGRLWFYEGEDIESQLPRSAG